jgi:hypothetical protein
VLVQPSGVLVGSGNTLLNDGVALDLVGGLVGTSLDVGSLRLGRHFWVECSVSRESEDDREEEKTGKWSVYIVVLIRKKGRSAKTISS